jgi:hypothetical protein
MVRKAIGRPKVEPSTVAVAAVKRAVKRGRNDLSLGGKTGT